MKTLTNIKATVTGSRLTLTADIVDQQYGGFPSQQQTIVHVNPSNAQHLSHVQISQEAVFVKAPGKQCGFALRREQLVEIAKMVEPLLNYAPVFKSKVDSKTLTADVGSELDPQFQWEVSKTGFDWKPVDGQTTKALDKTKVQPGDFVRLVATSEAGSMTSNMVQI